MSPFRFCTGKYPSSSAITEIGGAASTDLTLLKNGIETSPPIRILLLEVKSDD
jgi:hypothetical protein